MIDFFIRPFTPEDFDDWLVLWEANNDGYCPPAVTQKTWVRLMDAFSQVHGLGAFKGKRMVGLVHYILHPVTGSIEPVGYMQDLFVDSTSRKQGIGKALVKALAEKGKEENWNRLYWLAQTRNKNAQALYKTLGTKLDFTLHVWPLGLLKK
ncbi:MAG: GNAT family N-acetyltransferase [Alphaproteobacteria bacterium]|nr:GNAT family N-acetyltransferase [Alphaproteobacteria bacterium]